MRKVKGKHVAWTVMAVLCGLGIIGERLLGMPGEWAGALCVLGVISGFVYSSISAHELARDPGPRRDGKLY